GLDRVPLGVVEVDRSSFRYVVVRFDGPPRRFQVGAWRIEIGLYDRGVAVAPLSFDQAEAVGGAKVNQRARSTVDRSSDRMLCAQAGRQGDWDGRDRGDGDDAERVRSHVNPPISSFDSDVRHGFRTVTRSGHPASNSR